jgi:hypothetical protein
MPPVAVVRPFDVAKDPGRRVRACAIKASLHAFGLECNTKSPHHGRNMNGTTRSALLKTGLPTQTLAC